jgi:riboflavin kinase / FMN adenylyltransferase
MTREFGLENVVRDPASIVTVGTFDGVHVGHQAVLQYLKDRAKQQGGRSVVVTFNPHPREVVHGEEVPLLTTVEERAEVLASFGIDRFVCIRFTPEFARLEAREFVEDILVGQVGLREIVIGYDHGFGRGREGDRQLLVELGAQHDFAVDVIPAQVVSEHVVSSTQIRAALEAGDVATAAEMLGRPHSVEGTVVPGDGRGRGIGYPTANIVPTDSRKVLPARGVYAVHVEVGGTSYGAMANIGIRPTFGGDGLHLEAHVFDFEGDLYGQTVRVSFRERLREEKRFASADELRAQLSRDGERCRAVLEALN